MGNRSPEHGRDNTRAGSGWMRVNRRAVRLAAFSLLLPVPVAMAVPQSATVPNERLVAMSSVPVRGVGDTVLPRVMPVKASKAEKDGPSASMTRVRRREQAQVFRASDVAANGVPQAALRAYRTAEATMAIADPSCELSWALMAGIGRVESDHGRYAGAVLGRDGVSSPEILGLPLNGVGPVAAIADTDGGSLDDDKVWDRAVGPMQFIPSTWSMVGVDGDGDGKRDPHDLDDAALAAAAYLCVGGNDLSTTDGMQQAVYSYNHSAEYVSLVLGLADAYQKGLVDLPELAASPMSGLASSPGVDVGLNEGRGVPIGTSDDTSTKEHGDKPGKGAETKEHGDGPAGNKADDPNRPNNDRDNQPRGGTDSTPPRGGSDGGNGTGNRSDNGDTGGGNGNGPKKPPANGGGNGGSGNGGNGGNGNGGDWLGEPKPKQPPKTEKPPKTPEPTEPPETEEPTEPPETEKPAEPLTGELVFCDEDEDTLCLIINDDTVFETDDLETYQLGLVMQYDPETGEVIPLP